MRSNLVIAGAAIIAVLVCDFSLWPSSWVLLLKLSAAAVAALWSIAALVRARGAVRPAEPRPAVRPAAVLLVATVAAIALIFWLRPVARLRIAASADALGEAAASGSLEYGEPRRIGLFDVSAVYVGADFAEFLIDTDSEGWQTTLRGKIAGTRGGVPVLSAWTWRRWIS
jgi:hypothetical protein